MAGDRKLERQVQDLMEELGVEEFSIDRARRHPRLTMVHAGTKLTYFMPGTPSDHRSWMNCRADVRRMVRRATERCSSSA